MSTTAAHEPPARILGVCAAIGEDFGISPDWLRIGLAVGLLFALEGVLIAYAALGLIVLTSRLLFPNRTPAAVETPVEAAPVATPADEVEWRQAA